MNLTFPALDRKKGLLADLSILAVTAVWGLTFVTVKNALTDMGPYTFIAIRFWLAALFLIPFLGRKLLRISRQTWLAGGGIGLFLSAGYIFQTLGLQYTTASNGGFITSLSVVFVPLFYAALTRRMPNPYALGASTLAAVGLGFLTLKGGGLSLNAGDLLVLGCAFSFALHIIAVGRFAPSQDTLVIVFIQILTVAILSSFIAPFVEPWPQGSSFSLTVINALLITAIPATSLAFLVQNWVQGFTSPSRTALIFSTEPIFAAAGGYFLLNETLGIQQGLGALLILAGILLFEFKGNNS